MDTEEWRPVEGFAGYYEVSSLGRVRSLPRRIVRRDGKPLTIPGKILTAKANGRGYPRVTLQHCGTEKWTHVHSLVAAAFLPPPPGPMGTGNQFSVNHISGVKTDNRAVNLEYVTARENLAHARRTGLRNDRGVDNGRAKLTDEQVWEIRGRYQRGVTRQVDIAADYGVDQGTISRIVRGAGWRHHHGTSAQPAG